MNTAIVKVEPELISGSHEDREERAQKLANLFVGEMVPLLVQVRQDFFDKGKGQTICGVKNFTEYCTAVLRYSDRHIRNLIAGQNPASAKHNGSANRKPRESQTWTVDRNFLDKRAADELYEKMLVLPWRGAGPNAFAIQYGLSYVNGKEGGGAATNEISEIPEFLQQIAESITKKTRVRANYIQCHKFAPSVAVHPHYDPRDMIVPMICVGQERTFRVGDATGDKTGSPWNMPQERRAVANHIPQEQILMTHGSLLIFDGPTVHSMFPAEQDAQFNLNGCEWRISILFRFTSDCLRKNGTGKNRDTGETCDRKIYQTEQLETAAASGDKHAETALADSSSIKAAHKKFLSTSPSKVKRDTDSILRDDKIAAELAGKFFENGVNARVARGSKDSRFHVNFHDLSEPDVLRLINFFGRRSASAA